MISGGEYVRTNQATVTIPNIAKVKQTTTKSESTAPGIDNIVSGSGLVLSLLTFATIE